MIISSKKRFPRTAVLDMYIAVWTTGLNFWQKKDLNISPVFAQWMFLKIFLPQIFPPVVVNAVRKPWGNLRLKVPYFFISSIFFNFLFQKKFSSDCYSGHVGCTLCHSFCIFNKKGITIKFQVISSKSNVWKNHSTLNCTSDCLNQVLKKLLKRNDRSGKKDRSNYGNISKQKILAKKLILKGAPLDI